MSIELKIEPIEVAVLEELFKQKGVTFDNGERGELLGIGISKREYTGVGFFTDFSSSEALRIGPPDYHDRWLDAQATLNGALNVGFLIYIDSGSVTAIEGFTYGDEGWPDVIDDFEVETIEVTHIPPRTEG